MLTMLLALAMILSLAGCGATCYVPDLLGVVVGVVACAAFLSLGGLGTMAWTIRLWRRAKQKQQEEAAEA